MTQRQTFRSNQSQRRVVDGWMNILPGHQDAIELQLDIEDADKNRSMAMMLVEYWEGGQLKLQSLLPMRAFTQEETGWCVFLPAKGAVMVRAIDPEPTPPLLGSNWLDLDENTQMGTMVNVRVNFPADMGAGANTNAN